MSDITFRPGTPADAKAFTALLAALDRESPYMLLSAAELARRPAEWEQDIRQVLKDGALFLACDGEDVIGFGRAEGSQFEAFLALGLRQAYHRQGVGARLMQTLTDWAAQVGVRRLMLTVAGDNEPGYALFVKCGFEVEGVMPNEPRNDGQSGDVYVMSKWLKLPGDE